MFYSMHLQTTKVADSMHCNLFNLEGEFGGIRRPFPHVQPRISHLGHQIVNDVDASISKNELSE